MRLSKLIVPAAVAATLAMFVSHAGAQTMGEYAATTASVSSGASSGGTSLGSDTWAASSLGASFDERAGAASTSMQGSFAARATEMSGAASSDSGSRWPTSEFSDKTDRFAESSDRFGAADRFPQRGELSGSDRFPASRFSDSSMGLDKHFASSSGLDTHYSSAGEDTSGTTSQP